MNQTTYNFHPETKETNNKDKAAVQFNHNKNNCKYKHNSKINNKMSNKMSNKMNNKMNKQNHNNKQWK